MTGYNVLLDKKNNDEFYRSKYAYYYNVTINIETDAEGYDGVIKSMSFNVTDNDFVGENLVTITYDYSDVTIDIPDTGTGM